jgi:shikimate kinase
MQIFFLVGIKHSGKSNLGSYAAHLLKSDHTVEFVDTDDLVKIKIPRMTIREYYQREGKEAFKNLEFSALKAYLETLLHDDPTIHIIATGGGASDNNQLVTLMKSFGTIIYLNVPQETLFSRIMKGGVPPFLSEDDPEGSFNRLYTHRDDRYRQISNYMIRLYDCQTVPENGKLLANFLRNLIRSEEPCQEISLENQSP